MAKESDSEKEQARFRKAERSLLSRLNNIVRMTDLMAFLMVAATAMSAYATWRSAKISNLLFLVAERPYIGVEHVDIERPDNGAARIVIEYRNFGHIPAVATVVSGRVTLDGKPAGDGDARGRTVNAGIISPGVAHHLYSYLSDDAYHAIVDGRSEATVTVSASYRGPAGNQFCYSEHFAYDRRSGWFGAAGGSDDCAALDR